MLRVFPTQPHRRFADGFPNLFVKDAVRIRNRHVGFLASFHSSEVIFDQLSIIYQLPRMFVGSFTLVLPYFPTGTAERVCVVCMGGVCCVYGRGIVLCNCWLCGHVLMPVACVCVWTYKRR